MNRLNAGDISVVLKKSTLEHINFQQDGFLGEFSPGDKFILRVQLSEDCDPVDICRTSGKIRTRRIKGNERPYVEQIVAVQRNNEGKAFTSAHNNSIRIFEYGESGYVAVWSVGIFAQDGKFFVGIQRDYEMQFISLADGHIVCPEKEDIWPDFCNYVRKSAKWSDLPRETSAPKHEEQKLRYNQGQVKWYNSLTGVGCVRVAGITSAKNGLKSQEARVHFSHIESPSQRLRKLEPGQLVTYDQLHKLRRRYGQRKTDFEAELYGVRSIR